MELAEGRIWHLSDWLPTYQYFLSASLSSAHNLPDIYALPNSPASPSMKEKEPSTRVSHWKSAPCSCKYQNNQQHSTNKTSPRYVQENTSHITKIKNSQICKDIESSNTLALLPDGNILPRQPCHTGQPIS